MSGSETGSEGAERGGGRRGGDLASKTLLLVNILHFGNNEIWILTFKDQNQNF